MKFISQQKPNHSTPKIPLNMYIKLTKKNQYFYIYLHILIASNPLILKTKNKFFIMKSKQHKSKDQETRAFTQLSLLLQRLIGTLDYYIYIYIFFQALLFLVFKIIIIFVQTKFSAHFSHFQKISGKYLFCL